MSNSSCEDHFEKTTISCVSLLVLESYFMSVSCESPLSDAIYLYKVALGFVKV